MGTMHLAHLRSWSLRLGDSDKRVTQKWHCAAKRNISCKKVTIFQKWTCFHATVCNLPTPCIMMQYIAYYTVHVDDFFNIGFYIVFLKNNLQPQSTWAEFWILYLICRWLARLFELRCALKKSWGEFLHETLSNLETAENTIFCF